MTTIALPATTRANRLDGGKGDDTLIGGGGDDVFIVNEPGDRVSDSSGYDTVFVGVNFTLRGRLRHRGRSRPT